MIRRWLRTLPLYLVILAVLAALTLPDYGILLRHIFMLQNWSDADFSAQWFGVSWSLAVEEWFYLSFSILIFATCSYFGRLAALPMILAFVIVPLGCRILVGYPNGIENNLHRLHHDTFLRLDGIAWGVLLAWITLNASNVLKMPKTTAVLGFILCGIGLVLPVNVWTPSMMGIGCCGLLCGALAVSRKSWVIRLISEHSFSLYLIHGLALKAGVALIGASLGVPIALIFTMLLAHIAYRWVELPIMAIRPAQKTN